MVSLDNLLREGIIAGWTIFGPWGRGKESGAIEPGETRSKESEVGMMDFGMVEFDIIGREESKDESDTFWGLESEDGTCKEGVKGSENIGSCGIAALGQIWGSEMEVCGE